MTKICRSCGHARPLSMFTGSQGWKCEGCRPLADRWATDDDDDDWLNTYEPASYRKLMKDWLGPAIADDVNGGIPWTYERYQTEAGRRHFSWGGY